MSHIAYLNEELEKLNNEKSLLEASITEVLDRIAQYRVVCEHRPSEIPASWEPVLDRDGQVRGWVDTSYRFYKS